MKEIILATKNKNKTKEFKSIFNNISIIDLNDLNLSINIIENGSTFIENALIKCKTVYNIINKPVLADDSGLCVEQLNGEPGLYSASFGGENISDKERYNLLLQKIDFNKNLNASFVCALVFYFNPNKIYIIQEEIKGIITNNPRGKNGFGYDPIFFLPSYNKTMAELTNYKKNQISHRAKASKLMKIILKNSKIWNDL